MSWEQVKLGDIFEIARGGSPRPIDQYITDDPNGLNWISIKDASNSSKYIYKTEKKIKPEGLHKTRLVHPDDFLLTNSMSFGRPYIMKTTGCIHDGWLVLSADKTKVDTDYFYHLLGSDFMYRKFAGLAAGAVVKNLNTELVKSVSVPLPPLAEQRRIASILDQADELRQKRQQAIEKLDQLLQATFIDMFGDPVSNPKGWDKLKIEDIASDAKYSIKAGPFGSALKKEDYVLHGYKIYGQEQVIRDDFEYGDYYITEEKYKSLENCSISSRDVLISLVGTFGKISVVPDQFEAGIINPRLMKITFDDSKINPYFFKYLFSLDQMLDVVKSYSHGGTMGIVNVGIIKNIMIIVPPLRLQEAFIEILDTVLVIKNQHRQAINSNLFEALQNQAFSGTL